MKAIVLVRHGTAKAALQIQDVPLPEPRDHELRISVEASGLNFADVLARLGLYPEAPKPPTVLGYEVVGRVDAVGPNGSVFRPGQRVLAFTRFGGYASMAIAHELATVPIPETPEFPEFIDAASATALATQYCTAYFAAEEMARIHSGDHVLIHAAAGGVGTGLVQLAKRRGAVVYGTAGSAEKLAYLKTLGVDHPINYRNSDFWDEIQRLAKGRKLDLVFDSLGGSTYRKSFELLGPGGRIVSYGVAEMAGARKSFIKPLKAAISFGMIHPISLLMSSRGVIGVNMLRIADSRPDILNRCLRAVVGLIEKKELTLHPAQSFPAERIAEAHEALASRKTVGKVAIRWD